MTRAPLEAPILEGKLYPATGTGRPLPRPRLDSLREVLDTHFPVVVLVAPAGYGKSTLMARWHVQLVERGVSCAWLSLDEGDDDQARFTRYLVAALEKADSRIGQSVAGHLSGDFSTGVKGLLEALARDLETVQRRVVLFLDDLQFVQEPDVLETIDWLVNYAPRTVQFVIGSREEPRLRLGGFGFDASFSSSTFDRCSSILTKHRSSTAAASGISCRSRTCKNS